MKPGNDSGESSAPDGPQAGDTRQWVWLARLRRPQGRKGELFADILTDFPEKFAERRQLWLFPEHSSLQAHALARPIVLANHWLHKGGIILHFEGVNSISEAETLAGLIVAVPRQERTPLAEDETYIGDLIGCTLFDVALEEPVAIGEIESVDRSAGPVPLLVVHRKGARPADEILVPFAKNYLRKIDIAGKRIEMALPVGLVDLSEAEEA